MWKLIPVVLASSLATMAQAQTITDPDQIASKLRLWSQVSDDPVYYGEVRNVNRRTMTGTTHYQCLALAFIKYEAGVLHYAHKMWAKSRDGSCHYEDVTSRKVGNHGFCVRDTNAGLGRAVGTARMTKDNIDLPAAPSGRSIHARVVSARFRPVSRREVPERGSTPCASKTGGLK